MARVGSHRVSAGPRVSFVIPTFNEAGTIGAVIESIHRAVGDRFPFEITVVDNGSQDETVAIARTLRANVMADPTRTVAGLRNMGAAVSAGQIYVFLDGDVLLTAEWGEHIGEVLALLAHDSAIVTGSTCGVSGTGSWIEEYWFKPLLARPSAYINSGHLVVGRQLFEALGGFDESLKSGEDYDFSQRARLTGARIVNDPRLAVVHEGYPKTLAGFIRREIWHGQGDFRSLRGVLTSKVALASIGLAGLHLALLAVILSGWGGFRLAVALIVAIGAICIGVALARYRRPILTVLVNAYLYYWYFIARALSPLSLLIRQRRRWRSSPA